MYVIKHNIAILYLLLSSTVCEKNVICFDEKCVSSHAAKVESPLHVQLCFYDNLLPNNPTSWELNSFCKNQYKLSGDSDSSTNIEIAPLITIVYLTIRDTTSYQHSNTQGYFIVILSKRSKIPWCT